jgi:hypothetical protein
MKKKFVLSAACAISLVLSSILSVTGQEKQKKQEGKIDIKDPNHPLRRPVNPELVLSTIMPFGMSGDSNVSFPADLNFERQTVKGAPFSADLITDTVQVLPNGKNVTRQTVSTIFRDKEGRTRVEQTKAPPMSMVENLAMYKTIMISDPVSKQIYNLQPSSRIAYKSTRIDLASRRRPSAASASAGGGGNSKDSRASADPAQSSVRGPSSEPANAKEAAGQNSDIRKESLGKTMIEGVEAEGTRTIQTKSVGVAGNNIPVEIIDEKWYSPAMKMFILIKHSETNKGETTYRFTNIVRTEPEASLFQVPVDYKVQAQPKPGTVSRTVETRKKDEK